VSDLFLLVPAALPLARISAVSLADVEQLRSEYRRARFGKEQPWHLASLRIQAGENLYWGFTDLVDVLAGVRWAADPRLPARDTTDSALEVVHVDGDRLLADGRFVRPGAGSLASEVPGLLSAPQRQWLTHAVYSSPQWVFAPAGGDLASAASGWRRSPAQIVQAALAGAVRAAKSRAARQQLLRLPQDPRALTQEHLDELREHIDALR
jgi:hypothetical protein